MFALEEEGKEKGESTDVLPARNRREWGESAGGVVAGIGVVK